MTYTIEGLKAEPFQRYFRLDEAQLEARGARRIVADAAFGFPCRVSLRDAVPGDVMILVNHVSNDAPTPFRASHAIYVGAAAVPPPPFADSVPDMLDRRTLSLRAFDSGGMLRTARLARPGEADAGIRALMDLPEVHSIHAHNAAFGCFLARIERN